MSKLIRGGRILDPASGLEEIRDVLIEGNTITRLSPPDSLDAKSDVSLEIIEVHLITSIFQEEWIVNQLSSIIINSGKKREIDRRLHYDLITRVCISHDSHIYCRNNSGTK